MENAEKSNNKIADFGVILVVERITYQSQGLVHFLEPKIKESQGDYLQNNEET